MKKLIVVAAIVGMFCSGVSSAWGYGPLYWKIFKDNDGNFGGIFLDSFNVKDTQIYITCKEGNRIIMIHDSSSGPDTGRQLAEGEVKVWVGSSMSSILPHKLHFTYRNEKTIKAIASDKIMKHFAKGGDITIEFPYGNPKTSNTWRRKIEYGNSGYEFEKAYQQLNACPKY